MRRSKPFYLLGALTLAILMMLGAFFGVSSYIKKSGENPDEKIWQSFIDSFDWKNFPWENFPYDEFEDFPWQDIPWEDIPLENLPAEFPWDKLPVEDLPWDQLPEDFWNNFQWDNPPEGFDWNNVPWDNLPENFDWSKVPWDNMPENFDWSQVPWESAPGDFPWQDVPLDKLPEDFDWNNMPWENMPEDFDWNSVPWDDMPEDFDWGNVPADKIPEDFDWNNMPWEDMPEDFDWNSVPWEDMPEDFDWSKVPWDQMPEDFDWSRIPWGDLPPDFPWQDIPWQDMPPEFWQTFPFEDLPEGFPWFVLPWLLISPDLIPDGVLPEGFYPPQWECDHQFDESLWMVTREPTCVDPGERQNFCFKCKQIIKEEVGVTSHRFGADSICSVCQVRRLYFRSGNLTKPYDGTPLAGTVESITFVREFSALDEGDRLDLSAIEDKITFKSLNTVGVAPNSFSFNGEIPVVNENAGDGGLVSGWGNSKYYLAFEFGKLKIEARELTIITPDIEKTYDGVPLTGSADGVEFIGLAEGDVCKITFGEGLTGPGRAQNEVVSFEIVNSRGENVTGCYKVKFKYGWLTVNP